MPRCFVERCHNYGGKRLNIILHSFPNNLDKIKTWLRCIEQSGHVIRDMEELAERIFEGKTNNRFRVCSEHFTEQSYQPSGLRKTLRKDAVPSIFRDVTPQQCPWQKVKPALQSSHMDPSAAQQPHGQIVFDPLPINTSVLLDHRGSGQANVDTTIKATKDFQQHTKEGYSLGTKPLDVTRVILELTLDIICLLTGEDYIVVKKTSSHGEDWSRTHSPIKEPPPDALINVKNNEEKILKLTNKIMELLTGEKCLYLEDDETDIGTEHHQPLASLDDMVNGLSDPPSARLMEKSLCEENVDIHTPARHSQQYLVSAIKVEEGSYDGRTIPEPNADDTLYYPSTPIKEEPDSCDEGNFIDVEIHAPKHASPPVKEESVLDESENLTNISIYIQTDATEHYSPLIKEEPVTYEEEDFTEPNTYTPADHDKPAFCDGGNVTLPTDYVLEESDVCDEGRAVHPDAYAEAQTSSTRPECETEEVQNNFSLFDKGNLDTDIYALIKHAQAKYTFTRIEDGSSSEEEENSKDTDPPVHVVEQTQHRPPRSMGEYVPQTFQCPDCSECFTRKSGLINHRRNHRQEKLTCSKCGKVFSKRSSLQNHLTLHTGEKPFACPICGKCFARKSNLISHETIHSGKASFICAECGRYFVCKVHLTKHQIIHEK